MEADSVLSSEYVDVKGVETQVLKCGDLPRPASREKQPQHLFLIIPGNPGIPEYYEDFMRSLWQKSEGEIPVWCVSHAGHVTGPKHSGLGWTDIVRHPGEAYTLQGQTDHKINFIRQHVPPSTSLILIGHSIGCHIILNILPRLDDDDNDNDDHDDDDKRNHHPVLRCFMLFPTIERMAATPNGKIFSPALNYCRWTLTAFIKLVSYLSPAVHQGLLRWHFPEGSIPECGRSASRHIFNPACVNHASFMGKHEMSEVVDLQEGLVKKYVDKLSFYYGAKDSWCPAEFYFSFRAKFPQADVRLCEKNLAHAFVLDSSEVMAHLLWEWLSPRL